MNTLFRQLLTAFACTAVMAFGTAPVHAVDTPFFELDGNTVDNSGAGLPDDWNNFSVGSTSTAGTGATATTGIIPDSAPKVFTKGSKDILDINEWFWRSGSSPPKDDMLHAYAASYQPNAGDPLIVYFGSNREAFNGTATVGFWFFKNNITLNADGSFNGVHAEGDVLVVLDYTNGGAVGDIVVYEWTGGALAKIYETTNTSLTGGLFCNAADGAPADSICAITNGGGITIPWAPGEGAAGQFLEGGINLTALIPGSECFASFMATSRSSVSETAETKNFILDRFPVCDYNVTKSCPSGALISSTQIRYNIEGTVNNTGGGSLNNVSLSDDPAAETLNFVNCTTGAVIGTTLASLPGHTSACYAGTFLSSTNGATDTITATGTFAGAQAATTRTSPLATCPQLVLEGALEVTKVCEVVLEDAGSQIVVKVNFSGTVTNPATSDFALTNVTVLNDQPAADTQVASYATLAVGETQNFSGSYYPSAIGGPLPGNPLCATFSDSLTASGTGPAIAGSPTVNSGPPVSATCNLCPPGQTCPND